MKTLKTAILISLLSISFNSFADLKTGLIAYYPFNGNANDESGNNHNGIINDATLTKDSLGKANSAYNFNGYNSYISVSDALDLRLSNKIASISLFIKSLSDNQLAAVIRKGISCNIPGWSMDSYTPSTNPFIFLAWNDLRSSWAWNVSNKENITQGEWHHIVMVSDGKVATIYLDGKFINSSSVDSSINIDTNSPMFIGAAPPGACGSVHAFYNGDIDEVRIYNRTLTVSEVTALYQQGANTTPTITSITPTVAVLDQPTTFTVTGTNLTNGMGFTISDCDASNLEIGTGTDSQRQFQCTPHGTAGQKTGSVLKNLSGSSLYDFKVLYYDLSPDQYNIKLGGRITWPTTNSTTNFWEHRYWKPSEDRECFTSDKESTCATHTGRDTRLDRDGGKIKSYGFGQIKNIELGDRGCRLLSYISITHLLNNGETVQANLLHGNYDGSIQKNDYVVKQQSLGTESTKGACGSQHLHTEIASIPKLSWVYTSNAIPDLYGNRIPDENYQKDDLTAYYDKNRFDKKGLENPIYYSPDATFDKDKHSELLAWLAIDNLTPSFESGYSVYGIVNNPLYGQLNLKRVNSKLFKAIGILIKNGSDRNEANWLELADTNGKWLAKTWTGNMAYNDTLVVSANVSDNYPVANQYTYTQSGDYLAIPFVSETGTSTVKGYPVIFSILDNEKSKVIDNDKTIDNAKTTYLSSGIAKQRPGYYLTSDVAFGQSGATAKWLPNVAGNYKVSVFIPETTNSKVIYKVKTTGTTAQLACVIQDRTQGAWASLVWSAGDKDINGDGKMNVNDLTCVSGGSTTEPTQFNFSKNGYVVASLLKTSPMGNNSHLKSSDQVAFDAVKFEFVPQ